MDDKTKIILKKILKAVLTVIIIWCGIFVGFILEVIAIMNNINWVRYLWYIVVPGVFLTALYSKNRKMASKKRILN